MEKLEENVSNFNPKYLLIEPFYGGSHKQLIDCLINGVFVNKSYQLITLTPKKWHWRARTASLYLSQIIPDYHYEYIFTSSVLNLAELIALMPQLNKAKKIVYFHENQLAYPKQKEQERDFQYGYNQIITCLVADIIIFNSFYNQNSFLNAINKFLKKQPDYRPKDLKEKIFPKCQVIYFPIEYPNIISKEVIKSTCLHLVWPHRWEYDKDPNTLFKVLYKLNDLKLNFKLSIIGQSFSETPVIFEEAKEILKENIINWGYLPSREKYYQVLRNSDIVISTAKHEFFGVSMLEAAFLGCLPICPNNLVYPEIYPKMCLYNNDEELFIKLRNFIQNPDTIKNLKVNIDFEKFDSKRLMTFYKNLFDI